MLTNFSESEFENLFTSGVMRLRTTSTEKAYIVKKKLEFMDLINELDAAGVLIQIDKTSMTEINQNLGNYLLNAGHVGDLYKAVLKLSENQTRKNTDRSTLIDQFDNKYTLTTYQTVIIAGWAYVSACEFIREWFTNFIDFSTMKNNKSKPYEIPTGIGQLKWVLKDAQFQQLAFFADIDEKLRNSFAHVNFELKNGLIYCKHKPEIHALNPKRPTMVNSQKDYITIEDLLWSIIHADRSGFPLMTLLAYLYKKNAQ